MGRRESVTRPHTDDDTGHPTAEDLYPRIRCAPEYMDGRPYIAGTRVPVDRILRELALEGAPIPSMLMGKIREADVKAALTYAADITRNLHALWARLQSPEKKP